LVRLLESRGVATTVAGAATTLFVGSQVVGALGIPALADRLDARRWAVAVCGALAAVGTAALAVVAGVGPAVGAAAVAGVGIGGLSPLVRALPVELEGIGAARTGAAVGLVFAVGEIGGFAGPFLVGTLYDLTGSFAPGLAVLSVGGLAAVLAGAALVRRA
jgi:cyanate permease